MLSNLSVFMYVALVHYQLIDIPKFILLISEIVFAQTKHVFVCARFWNIALLLVINVFFVTKNVGLMNYFGEK